MGINYSIDAEARIVRLDYVGETSADELSATLRAIFRSPIYEPGFGFLVARRNVTPATIPHLEHVVGLSILHRARLVGARWAFVFVSAASVGTATATLPESATFPLPVQIQFFEDVDGAERWLRETARKQ